VIGGEAFDGGPDLRVGEHEKPLRLYLTED
jgi:hypothetical protein